MASRNMFPRVSPRDAAFQPSQDSVDVASIPPPPPRNLSNGPDSRQHGRRPPTLTTSFPYLQGGIHLNTPIVTPSSLSSPFALSALGGQTLSAGVTSGPASRGVSPENHRLSGNFTNMAYNPQEWASGRQSVESRQRRDAYGDPLNTPPPPYPDQRVSQSTAYTRPGNFASPDASLNTSPVLQHATLSNESNNYARAPRINAVPPNSRHTYESRRTSRIVTSTGPDYVPAASYQHHPSQQHHPTYPGSLSFQVNGGTNVENNPPPPPPRRSPPNALSNPEADSIAAFHYGRRSTSAGPVATAGPSAARTTRTSSGGLYQVQSDWNNGASLPGPPPGPPPPSTRSRSAGSESDRGQHGARQRPPRLYLRDSNLETIPATPAVLPPATPGRASMFPLRIDTGTTSTHGKAPAPVLPVESREASQVEPVKTGASALARRSALRGPAARTSIVARSRSRSMTGKTEANEVQPSPAVSTNPWASALEQSSLPQNGTSTESSLLLNSHASTSRNLVNNLQSQTPPITPGLVSGKILSDQNLQTQQVKVLPTPPLSQKPLLSANSIDVNFHSDDKSASEGEDLFYVQALQRHAEFLKKEKEAGTDLDRLMLFTAFMQQESLLRKERYLAAFNSEGFDLDAARNAMFNARRPRRASEREVTVMSSNDESPVPTSGGSTTRNDSAWTKEYRPALSPIASMGYDEQSSRGRPPSRWWESATGSQSDGPGHHVSRSKRESKYMSLSTKLIQSMENEMDPLHEESSWPAQSSNEKANPETFGFYDEETVSPPVTAHYQKAVHRSSMLDISRFITLPPPYPRHFPAVNNSHPDLTEYRTTVRTLSDLEDAKNRQSRHEANVQAMRSERQQRLVESRKKFRMSIQNQIADGSISYAEAADAERHVKAGEHDTERQGLQAEFDTLQDVVINPLHEQLNDRIERLGQSLQSLQRDLFASAANQDPDQPVQEGDDVPELLEQLTQLKWLFEAREVLHQELFNLMSQRNDAYKAIVALPYLQSNNLDKVRDTDAFFEKDAATRHATFCAEALKRHESFLRFVEDNALRGIEMQSSAFWDITPGLVDLVQKIPADLNTLEIQIPEQELQENPSYQNHPLQYLYLLLRHAEKSSYQYIEGQINLHCLVHEVKTSSLSAHYRASEAQQKMAGDQSINLATTRVEDERELTDELKNRATMIEEQWQDALGKQLGTMRERVKRQLQKRDAWDDIAAEAEG